MKKIIFMCFMAILFAVDGYAQSIMIMSNDKFIGEISDGNLMIFNTVKSIDRKTFRRDDFSSVTIPNSATVEQGAFSGCSSLTAITVEKENSSYSAVDGVLFNKAGTMLLRYPVGRTGHYDIPNSVTEIGGYAFDGCSHLTSVTISNNVKVIERYAFDGCSSLASITVKKGNPFYSSIDGVLFVNAGAVLVQYPKGKIGHYDIPNSVKSIGESAFENCRSLTSVTIPGNVTVIVGSAFDGCRSLTDVTVEWKTPLSFSLYGDPFDDKLLASCTLHVPAGTKALYQADKVWQKFGTIVEYE
jgi:hypothetical protein